MNSLENIQKQIFKTKVLRTDFHENEVWKSVAQWLWSFDCGIHGSFPGKLQIPCTLMVASLLYLTYGAGEVDNR